MGFGLKKAKIVIWPLKQVFLDNFKHLLKIHLTNCTETSYIAS